MAEDKEQKLNTILKVVVGSQAHGLADENSDWDYRGVFVVPTEDLLKIGGDPKTTSWIEGKVDDTKYEVGKFLFLATKCNPTILEVFLAPIVQKKTTAPGRELRSLFSCIWNSKGVFDAFRGYGLNQRKKFLENKDVKPQKYACAYLRTLYQGCELLNTGTFSIDMTETPIYETLKKWKRGELEVGEVMQTCFDWEKMLEIMYGKNPSKETDLNKVNDFLLSIRIENLKKEEM